MTQPALEVEQLSVTLGTERILHDLSFVLPRGTTLAVIGPNGAGKTVLLRALIGGVPYRGRIHWTVGGRIGYVPQKLDLERDLPMTGLDLLVAKARLTHSAIADADNALRLVDLGEETARRPIGQLSGGEFQRVLLAFALMGHPSVLLFDEPTAGVDAPGEHVIYHLVRRLQRERDLTVVMVSHELSVVYEYADQVLCLSREHTFFGSPKEVLTPAHLNEVYGSRVRFHHHDEHAKRR